MRERITQDRTNLLMNPNIPFLKNKLLHLIIVIFVIFWGVMAISPTDRTQWFLESILTVGAAIVLGFTYKKFHFSNLSYLLMFIFLCIHTYAAHFTYQNTPVDMWLKSSFHTQRSYFDRAVHFMFGLFWTYPCREFLIRVTALRGFWTYTISVAIILSSITIFEIIEMIAGLVAGQAGETYVGLQGDVFDTQKDMGLGLIGGIISMGILAWIISRKKEKSS